MRIHSSEIVTSYHHHQMNHPTMLDWLISMEKTRNYSFLNHLINIRINLKQWWIYEQELPKSLPSNKKTHLTYCSSLLLLSIFKFFFFVSISIYWQAQAERRRKSKREKKERMINNEAKIEPINTQIKWIDGSGEKQREQHGWLHWFIKIGSWFHNYIC